MRLKSWRRVVCSFFNNISRPLPKQYCVVKGEPKSFRNIYNKKQQQHQKQCKLDGIQSTTSNALGRQSEASNKMLSNHLFNLSGISLDNKMCSVQPVLELSGDEQNKVAAPVYVRRIYPQKAKHFLGSALLFHLSQFPNCPKFSKKFSGKESYFFS